MSADAASVRPEDLVASDQIFPNRVGEIYHLAYNPRQRWYYTPKMERDEVLLIKGWDSLGDRARFTPHSAFELPETPADAARPVACNQVPGARGRGQGTETLAQLSGFAA
jgi:hypothetical protein